ncbi:MAG TPA: PEP-CTERM sorting domain-containing protein [Bryocella sp.]|nr:PEP-CTERM sorting domain-containing protein [Bryocella sp.]
MKILNGISVCALLIAGAVATPSFATLLPDGGSVTPPPTVSLTGFTVLNTTGTQGYSYAAGADAGTYLSEVGTWAGNPFGASDLTFVYQVTVTAGDIQHISGSNFAGTLLDVAQSQTGTGFSTGERAAADATFNFGVVEFDFPGAGGALTPGANATSYILIVNTNATSYSTGTIGLIDGGGTTVNGFMPGAAPEPSTLSLLGTGLLAAGAGLRRRMVRK